MSYHVKVGIIVVAGVLLHRNERDEKMNVDVVVEQVRARHR